LEILPVIVGAAFALALTAFAIWFLIWLCIQVLYRMAEERNRDGYVWVAVSLLGSPFLAIILLAIAGSKED